MDTPSRAEFQGAHYGPEIRSLSLASFQSLHSRFDEHGFGSVPGRGLAAGADWLHGSKSQVGDEGLPGQNFRGIHQGQPAQGSGNRSWREVGAGGGIHAAGRHGIGDGRKRQGEGPVERYYGNAYGRDG